MEGGKAARKKIDLGGVDVHINGSLCTYTYIVMADRLTNCIIT